MNFNFRIRVPANEEKTLSLLDKTIFASLDGYTRSDKEKNGEHDSMKKKKKKTE